MHPFSQRNFRPYTPLIHSCYMCSWLTLTQNYIDCMGLFSVKQCLVLADGISGMTLTVHSHRLTGCIVSRKTHSVGPTFTQVSVSPSALKFVANNTQGVALFINFSGPFGLLNNMDVYGGMDFIQIY